MKVSLLVIAAVLRASLTFARPPPSQSHFFTWSPPGLDDVRGPCPMLNTLANHGFLPHSGKNITEEDTVSALNAALNVDRKLGVFLFQHAITTNPAPNATDFSLDDLSRHNILEHDASLSRGDYYFGDDHTFNQTIFDQTRSYWTAPVIDVEMAAKARLARVNTSKATNPTFNLTRTGTLFSFGETAAYIIALGDRVTGTARRAWVEYLFENEHLPLELGWSKRENPVSKHDLGSMLKRVVNATGSSPEDTAMMIRRGGFHGGI